MADLLPNWNFRAYIEGYLKGPKKDPQRDDLFGQTTPPSPEGLPLGIYVFSKDNPLDQL
ncbi:MAG: hypothetical protein CM15mP44_7190 [Candidatus Neomarinimicrobiota bacterium]|nr:MAG: hypothetical protein CM15mP44_7190 [Candidatus Neomarinimicrobiota bacterium]